MAALIPSLIPSSVNFETIIDGQSGDKKALFSFLSDRVVIPTFFINTLYQSVQVIQELDSKQYVGFFSTHYILWKTHKSMKFYLQIFNLFFGKKYATSFDKIKNQLYKNFYSQILISRFESCFGCKDGCKDSNSSNRFGLTPQVYEFIKFIEILN